MDVTLWICQGLLAALFLVSGSAKISMSKQRMIETGQTGVAPFPLPMIRLVAACELAGVVGLIAPKATGLLPVLTAVAAIGLAVVMVGAIISHTKPREPGPVVVNMGILAICCFIAVATL
jgi:uncharacterized membrane protein YphA (DoxX/SURF4 family)